MDRQDHNQGAREWPEGRDLVAAVSTAMLDATGEKVHREVERCLKLIGEALSLDRVRIRWVDDRGSAGHRTRAWQRLETAGSPQTPDSDGLPWIASRMERAETVRLSRLEDLPKKAAQDLATLKALGTASYLGVPVVVAGRSRGHLELATVKDTCAWADEVADAARVLARILGCALARASTERAFEERLQFQHLSAELSGNLLRTPAQEVDRVVEGALRKIGEALSLDRVSIRQFDPDRTTARLSHLWLRTGERPMPVSQDLGNFPWLAPQLLNGKAVSVARLDDLPPEAAKDVEQFRTHSIRSILAVPLVTSEERLGACFFSTMAAERTWPARVVADLRGLAEMLASALVRARKSLELAARERDLEAAQKIARVGSGIYDVAADRLSFSDEAMRIVGTDRRSMSLREFSELFHEEDRERVRQAIQELLDGSTQTKFEVEYRFARPDGSVCHVRDHAWIERYADGTPKRGIVTWLDITERVRAEQALRRREADLRRSQRAATVGTYTLDPTTHHAEVSQVLKDLLGIGSGEFDFERYKQMIHPEDRERVVAAFMDRMASGADSCQAEYRVCRTDGMVRFVRDNGEIERNADGSVHRVYGAIVDVTHYKDVEELLTSALAEVGALQKQLQAENIYLREEIRRAHGFDEIVGESDGLKQCLRLVEQVAPTSASVLISGETGTGKELIARAVHEHSDRKQRTLVKVNCAALPAALIESELFGHEKGAFTGANRRREGRFELADGGTLFLDEIGDLPLALQGKLLRVLQEGEFERVGGTEGLKVDVRLIAATNRDLATAVEREEFRADLYYRLNVFPIRVPPLRERRDDIPLLVRHFVAKHAKRLGRTIDMVSQRLLDCYAAREWPGNLRELENAVERTLITSTGGVLDLDESSPEVLDAPSIEGKRPAAAGSLREVERRHIESVLEKSGWTIEGALGAASLLGLPPSSLRSKMKKLRIERRPPDARDH